MSVNLFVNEWLCLTLMRLLDLFWLCLRVQYLITLASQAILATIYIQRNISHENIEYNQLFVTDITKYESTTR